MSPDMEIAVLQELRDKLLEENGAMGRRLSALAEQCEWYRLELGERDEAIALLGYAARVFETYAKIHDAKGRSGAVKAAVNRVHAKKLRDFIAQAALPENAGPKP